MSLALGTVALAAQRAAACDTPVYRYAMYRWEPAPYVIYYFHDQPAGEADRQTQQTIAELVDGERSQANLVLQPVDVEDPEVVEQLPPDVKQAWLDQQDQVLPYYLVVTPHGAPLFAGALTEQDVRDLVESPGRAELARQLEAGKAGVLLLLTGKEEQANQQAEALLHTLVEEAADGKIYLPSRPAGVFGESADAAQSAGIEVGLLKISRTDPQEQWLVRSLLEVEHDLKEFDDPMVFAVYGRGRALPPYLGRGITRDNLIECIQFVNGPCSCTVKDQNPGVDLLVRYDWLAASESLLARYGVEDNADGPLSDGDFLPELLIPSGESEAVSELTAESSTDSPPPAADADGSQQANRTASQAEYASASAAQPPNDGQRQAAAPSDSSPLLARAGSPDPSASEPSGDEGALSGLYLIAAGLGIALLGLVGATYFMLRPRREGEA